MVDHHNHLAHIMEDLLTEGDEIERVMELAFVA